MNLKDIKREFRMRYRRYTNEYENILAFNDILELFNFNKIDDGLLSVCKIEKVDYTKPSITFIDTVNNVNYYLEFSKSSTLLNKTSDKVEFINIKIMRPKSTLEQTFLVDNKTPLCEKIQIDSKKSQIILERKNDGEIKYSLECLKKSIDESYDYPIVKTNPMWKYELIKTKNGFKERLKLDDKYAYDNDLENRSWYKIVSDENIIFLLENVHQNSELMRFYEIFIKDNSDNSFKDIPEDVDINGFLDLLNKKQNSVMVFKGLDKSYQLHVLEISKENSKLKYNYNITKASKLTSDINEEEITSETDSYIENSEDINSLIEDLRVYENDFINRVIIELEEINKLLNNNNSQIYDLFEYFEDKDIDYIRKFLTEGKKSIFKMIDRITEDITKPETLEDPKKYDIKQYIMNKIKESE